MRNFSFREAVVGDLKELSSLFQDEFDEVGEMKEFLHLDIDFQLLEKLMSIGTCRIYVVVNLDGAIVGYSIYTVFSHPKYRSTVWAAGAAVWMDPSGRLPRVSLRFMEFCEASLKSLGCQIVQTGSRSSHPAAGKMYKHLGYQPYEMGWVKKL